LSANGIGHIVDEWGIAWEIPAGFANYEITRSPLWGNISLNDVRSYRWPDPHLNMLPLENIRKQAETLRENPQKAVIANLALQIHTQSYFLRGFSDYLTDMILQPAVIEAIMDGVLDIFTERARIILSQIGDLVDIVYVADDLGTQNGPLFSPELYRKILKPRQKILFETIKKNSGVKILYHSCGSVVEFIDDLVEIGVDILNPVQVSAGGMDSRELKRKFGHKVCFWGAIDTQKILPFGTPATVKAEVNKRLADLKDGGGFVAAAVHNIRPEVPPENIVAMIEAVKEFGVY